jgi:hypothetical protein
MQPQDGEGRIRSGFDDDAFEGLQAHSFRTD